MTILDLMAVQMRVSVGIQDAVTEDIDWLDVTSAYKAFEPADAQIAGGTGLIKTTAKLMLAASPVVSPGESMNPLLNPARWARGNPVWVEYWDGSEWLTHPRGRLRILNPPGIPHEGKTTLEIELGCLLEALDRRSPPEDSSGIEPGSTGSLGGVLNALAARAGLPPLVDAVGGAIVHPVLSDGGHVQTMGRLAWEFGYVLWIDREERLRAQAVPYLDDETLDFVLSRGRDDFMVEPMQGTEDLVKRVVATGVGQRYERVDNPSGVSWSRTGNTRYAIATQTKTELSGSIREPIRTTTTWTRAEYIFPVEQITINEGTENEETIDSPTWCLVEIQNYPVQEETTKFRIQRSAIVKSSVTKETSQYDLQSRGGKLRSRRKQELAIAYSVAYYKNNIYPVDVLVDKQVEREAYKYRIFEGLVDEIETTTMVNRLSLTESDAASFPGDNALVDAYKKRQYWERRNKQDWQEVQADYSLLPSEAANTSVSTSGGNSQPPQPDRVEAFTRQEYPFSGECDFEAAGAGVDDERTYEMKFSQGPSHCAQYATMEGTLLYARALTVTWGTSLRTEFLEDYTPLKLGVVQLYDIETGALYNVRVLSDGITYQHTETRAAVAGNGMRIGTTTLDPVTQAMGAVTRPYSYRLRERVTPVPASRRKRIEDALLMGEAESDWIVGQPANSPGRQWIDRVYARQGRLTGIFELVADLFAFEVGVEPIAQLEERTWLFEIAMQVIEGDGEPIDGIFEIVAELETGTPGVFFDFNWILVDANGDVITTGPNGTVESSPDDINNIAHEILVDASGNVVIVDGNVQASGTTADWSMILTHNGEIVTDGGYVVTIDPNDNGGPPPPPPSNVVTTISGDLVTTISGDPVITSA